MKTIKITYYITTALISLAMAFSAWAYLNNPELKAGFQHLGFPDYFRIELGIAKALAAIALWLPFRLAKEFAYFGLSISFVSAFIAHVAVGDPMAQVVAPVMMLVLLLVSYLLHRKLSSPAGSLPK